MTSGQSIISPFIVFLAPLCLAGRFKAGDRPMITGKPSGFHQAAAGIHVRNDGIEVFV
jgi:hypothetical protein